MRYGLKGLMLAMPWFGLAVFAIAHDVSYFADAQAAHERGQWLCTRWPIGNTPIVLAAIAGLATTFRSYWLAAVTGIPALLWIAIAIGLMA